MVDCLKEMTVEKSHSYGDYLLFVCLVGFVCVVGFWFFVCLFVCLFGFFNDLFVLF